MSLFIEIPKFRKIVNECDHSLDLIYNQESKYSTCAYHAAKDCDSNLSNDELNELKRVNESIKFNTNIINNHNNILNNYFINYNFKRDYDQICKHIQKLYIKHMNTIKESNMEVFDEFLNVLKLYLNFIYFKEDLKPPYELTYLLNNKSYTLKTKDNL